MITNLLTRECINLNLKGQTKQEIIDEMVEILYQGGKLNDKEEYKKAILAREAQSSTGLEEGIAIPHAKTSAVKIPSIAFGLSKNGVDYESLDGEPSKLFFMIAAPANASNTHIEILSKLTTMLLDDEIREKLLEVKTPEEVISILTSDVKEEKVEEVSQGYPEVLAVTACPTGIAHTYTLRWPYRGSDSAEPFDIRTDTNDKFYYLWRKFVPEGLEQTERDTYGLDIPLIRYAEVLLLKAEALNEWGSTHESEAIRCVNEVRRRAGHVELNNATYPATKVNGQSDLRERIRNEYYWEIGGEDSMYFHELRWGTWKDKKFDNNRNGLMQMWGETTYTWYWLGDQCWSWPIPAKEMEMNSNLEQNEGWIN